MPICRECKKDVLLEDFPKTPRNNSGRSSKCKPCTNKAMVEYSRRYHHQNKHRVSEMVKKRRDADPEKTKIRDRNRYLQQKEKSWHKILARKAVKYALDTGLLKKGDCRWCGSDKSVEGHHESYLKENWLKVWWMCKKHHAERHRELKSKVGE